MDHWPAPIVRRIDLRQRRPSDTDGFVRYRMLFDPFESVTLFLAVIIVNQGESL